MDATLKVLSGLLSGQSVRLPRKLVIGRAEDCDFQVDSEFVSAHHCALLLDEDLLSPRSLVIATQALFQRDRSHP